MTAKIDIYQDVTDRIIAALEGGAAPWLKPWADGKCGGVGPHNAATGRAYNGINWLVLSCSAYTSDGWLTYKQAKELGGQVRKGEKGTHIVFWSFPKIQQDDGTIKVVPFAKGFTVFNVQQCDGLDENKLWHMEPVVAGQTSINALATRIGADVHHGGSKAYYTPQGDFIGMPTADSFESADAYAATLAHELVHWTGHKSRCDRQFGKRFGDDAYAFEELVAEIGSAFVCAQMGIPLEGLQHSNYLASWLKVLKADKRAIFTASSQAKRSSEFLLTDTAVIEKIAA
jgi:antirestriction protein ArdC